jgi:hypothetical protein
MAVVVAMHAKPPPLAFNTRRGPPVEHQLASMMSDGPWYAGGGRRIHTTDASWVHMEDGAESCLFTRS